MFELFHECGSRGYLNREMNRQTNARSISPRNMQGDLAKIKESQTKLREVNNCRQVARGYLNREMTLPAEVWFHIFRFLPLKELKEVMLVCKDFYSICEMETLWKNVILSRQKLSRSDSDKELVLMRMGRFKFKQKIDLNDYIDD